MGIEGDEEQYRLGVEGINGDISQKRGRCGLGSPTHGVLIANVFYYIANSG